MAVVSTVVSLAHALKLKWSPRRRLEDQARVLRDLAATRCRVPVQPAVPFETMAALLRTASAG